MSVRHMRVLLADDQSKVRSALRLLLEQQPGIQVLGEAVDTTGLLDWVTVTCPDVVLLDWELPGLGVDRLLPTLRDLCPRLKVIALSGRQEARQAALDAGVDAFVSKGDPPERLLAAVNDCCQQSFGCGPQRDSLLCAGSDADAHDQHNRADLADRSKPDSPADHRDRYDLADGTPIPRANSAEWRIALGPSDVVGAEGLKVGSAAGVDNTHMKRYHPS